MRENLRGDLIIGSGVIAKGTVVAPGTIEVSGTVEGSVKAHEVFVALDGKITGTTNADHLRVAGKVLETSVANESLVVEPTGYVSGKVTYASIEIHKGGNISGDIQSTPVNHWKASN